MIARLKLILGTAVPIAIGQIGQMAMILVDMFVVGKLGAAAIGGVGLGNAFFYVFGMFSAGVLFGLDYFVSHAQGRGDRDDAHKWLWQGCWLSLILSVVLGAIIERFIPPYLTANFPAEIAVPAVAFIRPLTLCLPGFLIFVTFRQYLQATGSVKAGTVVTLAALGINYGFNYALVFGTFGAPKMGIAGSGLATTLTRSLMATALVLYTFHRDRRLNLGLAASRKGVDPAALWSLVKMGLPIGLMVALEAGVFSLATALIAGFGVAASASHTIALNVASFTYTIPTAIAGAAAILVGQALGRGELTEVRRLGWTCVGVGAVVMACMGGVLGVFGKLIAGFFTIEQPVIDLCGKLIVLVAIFQVADGVQSVCGGVLRGAGETRPSMIANLVGYWFVGMPLGYWFGIRMDKGVIGFWMGLTVGLYAVAAMVLYRCVVRSRDLKEKLANA